MAAWRFDFRKLCCEFRYLEVVAGHDGDVLLSIYGVSNRADGSVPSENGFPKFLPCFRIKRAKPPIHVPMKDKIAGRRQDRAVSGHSADIEAENLSRRQINFCEACKRVRIRSGTRHYLPSAAALRAG